MKQSNLSTFFKRKINDDEGASTSASPEAGITTFNKHFKASDQIHPHDIGHFTLHGTISSLSSEKITTIQTLWTPSPLYTFPLIDKFKDKKLKLRFQHKWLTEFNWLCYSAKEEGAFCKYCVFFARTGGIGGQTLGLLVNVKMDNWKKAKEVSISISGLPLLDYYFHITK